jgi:hypothetical protein
VHGVPDLIDCVRDAFAATSEEVLQFYWDGSTPLSCAGSTWLRAVGDVCVCTSTDWEASGPYESIEHALSSADSLLTQATDPGLESSYMSEDELLCLARRLCPLECRVRINGSEYGWKDGKLVDAYELEEPEEDEWEDEEEGDDDDEDANDEGNEAT